jgi:hypothetical protein
VTKKRADKDRKARKKARKTLAPLLLNSPRDTPQLMPAAMAVPASALPGGPAPSLLETARTRWEHGEWSELLALDRPALEGDPERGKMALLLAAAHAQVGDMAKASGLGRQAMLWGCHRTLVARVLLSSAQNSLARVAAALEEDAAPHFEAAIRLVQPQADAALLGRTRRVRELARMGLLPEAAAVLEQEMGLARTEPGGASEDRLARLAEQVGALRNAVDGRDVAGPQKAPEPRVFDTARMEKVIGVYRNLPPSRLANFRYLDVKSLPRTGLHFMRNSFGSILQGSFSFCEWYTEPGCCRQMPCVLTGYATESQDRPMLRMVKSHDFNLSDPAFPTTGPIRRLILIRDPLYVLTSWWALQTLYLRADTLKRHGILSANINFAHAPHIMRAAYGIIDAEADMPPTQSLVGWLGKQVPYVMGFTAKWHEAARRDGAGTQIVRYRETPEAIMSIVDEIATVLDDETRARLETFRLQRDTIFKERATAFDAPSTRISAYMRENSSLFLKAAQEIIDQDSTGLLAGA